jgi:hypothetical protein
MRARDWIGAFALFSLSVTFVGGASAQTPVAKISGEVVRVDGQNLELRSKDGEELRVELSDHLRLSARSPVGTDAIKQEAYVGATAVPQPDGTLLASEVHVFPESMRGTAEGHRLLPPEPGNAAEKSTMTNATVTGITGKKSSNTMTNATVSKLSPGDSELTMTLTYAGGEKTVVVPQGTPIMKTETADRSALVPGAHVLAYAVKQPDGTLLSDRVSVGKDGYAPPA